MSVMNYSDVELDVPLSEEQAYVRHSYHEYVRVWNDLVRKLEAARGAGEYTTASRLAEELRHVWPQPADGSGNCRPRRTRRSWSRPALRP